MTGRPAPSPELICDVLEAIEDLNELKPIYLTVLRLTGDKKQALEAIKYVRRLMQEMREDAA